MATNENTSESEVEVAPGKLRTWWHPLLVNLLEWVLRDSCTIESEVNVSRMPLRLDVLVIRRELPFPPETQRVLAVLSSFLNKWTLLEFKGATDTLGAGDYLKFLGCAHLYLHQVRVSQREDVTLLIIAPRLTRAFQEEVEWNGHHCTELREGVHEITGGTFRTILLETNVLAGLEEPILTLLSKEYLEHLELYTPSLEREHHLLLSFVMQQIQQFQPDENFRRTHLMTGMEQTLEQMETAILERISYERRLRGIPAAERLKDVPTEELLKQISTEERLKGVPTEERLKGVPTEERLKDVTLEEVLKVLSEADLAKLRALMSKPEKN